MKRIIKNQEPNAFTTWKSTKNNKWRKVRSGLKIIIHASLMAEQGNICCYCEQRVSKNDSHVEHFRPKSKNKYPDLQLDYNNLHCSCQFNLEKGEPRHCGNSKGDWFNQELLISPLSADCESRFKFTADGDIYPRRENDAAAKMTIKKLRLDLDKLKALRASAIDTLADLPANDVKLFLEADSDDGFQPFYTTIRQVLAE